MARNNQAFLETLAKLLYFAELDGESCTCDIGIILNIGQTLYQYNGVDMVLMDNFTLDDLATAIGNIESNHN